MSKVILFRQKGSFKKTERFLKGVSAGRLDAVLAGYGQKGVEALAAGNAQEDRKDGCQLELPGEKGKDSIAIIWSNSNIVDGTPIAVILQYGHGTRNGGYVEGVDYINPAMRPIFDEIAKRAWEEVRRE